MLRRPRTAIALCLTSVLAVGLAAPASAGVQATVVDPATPDAPSAEAGSAVTNEQTSQAELTAVDPQGLAEPDATERPEGVEADLAGASAAEVVVPEDEVPADVELPEERVGDAAGTAEPVREVIALTEPLSTGDRDVHVVGASWAPGAEDVTVDVRTRVDDVWTGWETLPVETRAADEGGRAGTDPYVVTGAQDVQVRLLTASGAAPQDARLDVFGADVTSEDDAHLEELEENADVAETVPTDPGATQQDDAAQDDAAQDGGAQDGAAQDGASQDGAGDGAGQGPAQDGTTGDGPAGDGGAQDGDASPNDGAQDDADATTASTGTLSTSTASTGTLTAGTASTGTARARTAVFYEAVTPTADLTTEAGDADVTTADLTDDGTGTGVEDGIDVVQVASAAGLTAPRPTILTRAQWGARAPVSAMAVGTVKGATIHHTAGDNDYSAAQVPAILRGIQNFHISGRGWSDIGYNFLVDKYGRIWEGRAGGVEKTTKGVHAAEFNGVTTGISVMGNFETATVNSATFKAITSIVAWKLALHGVSPTGTFTYGGRTFPAVVGHRDVPSASTACPGRNLYPLLGTLRTNAARLQTHQRGQVSTDLNGDAYPDLVDMAGSGRSYLGTPPGTSNPFTAAVQVGRGWLGMDMLTGSASLRGAAGSDILARHRATGQMRVYHGDGKGLFAGVSQWGKGWNGMAAVVAPGDWTGDGRADLIGIQASTGNMYLYVGNGRGGVTDGGQIGRGWGNIRSVVAAGDMDGNGTTDLVALSKTNQLILYRGNGKGGFLSQSVLRTGVTGYTQVLAPGDVTGDGQADVLLRPSSGGALVTGRGTGRGGVVLGTAWGSGWDKAGLLVGVNGWKTRGQGALLSVDASTGQLRASYASVPARFRSVATVGVPANARLSAVVGKVTSSRGADVVSIGADNALYLSASRGDGTFAAARAIGQKWGAITHLAAAGDMDYDGTPDLLAMTGSGQLLVYTFASDGSGRIDSSFEIGTGFGAYHVFGVGGWSSSTGADVLAIHKTTGQMRWYVGRGRGRLTGGTVIGTGWNGMADVTALGDTTGRGNNDLLAREKATGRYWIYQANGKGGFSGRQAVSGAVGRQGP